MQFRNYIHSLRIKIVGIFSLAAIAFICVIFLSNNERAQTLLLTKTNSTILRNLVNWKELQLNINLLYYSTSGFTEHMNQLDTIIKDLEKNALGIKQLLTEDINQELKDQLVKLDRNWTFYKTDLRSLQRSLSRIHQGNTEDLLGFVSFSEATRISWDEKRNTRIDYSKADTELVKLKDNLGKSVAIIESVYGLLGKITTQLQKQYQFTFVAILIVVGLVIYTILFIFGRGLAQRIRKLEDAVHRVAEKDLTHQKEFTGKDEIDQLGNYLNNIIVDLKLFFHDAQQVSSIVHNQGLEISSATHESTVAVEQISRNISNLGNNFQTIANTVNKAAESISQILNSIEGLTQQTQEQNNAIDNTSSAVEEMNASINSVSVLTDDRKQRADNLLSVVKDGGEKVEHTFDSIKEISQEIDNILEVIEIINAVSQQTNILSMNAAIESAHAGEAGRGFAVVAEEIRTLAESTAENATEIDSSLRRVTEKIREALDFGQTSNESFYSIRKEVSSFSEAMSEISQNMKELSTGSQNILRSTHTIAEITKEIGKESTSIESRTGKIKSGMDSLEEITSEASVGIKEIETGTGEIHKSMLQIRDKNLESEESIETLNEKINSYKTSEDSDWIEQMQQSEKDQKKAPIEIKPPPHITETKKPVVEIEREKKIHEPEDVEFLEEEQYIEELEISAELDKDSKETGVKEA